LEQLVEEVVKTKFEKSTKVGKDKITSQSLKSVLSEIKNSDLNLEDDIDNFEDEELEDENLE